MEKFINSIVVIDKKDIVREDILNKFIKLFNNEISNTKDKSICKFVINTALDNIEELSEAEFLKASVMAKEEGWILKKHLDNFNTTTYTISKKLL